MNDVRDLQKLSRVTIKYVTMRDFECRWIDNPGKQSDTTARFCR